MDAAEPSLHDNGFYKVRHLAAIGAEPPPAAPRPAAADPVWGHRTRDWMPSATRHTRATRAAGPEGVHAGPARARRSASCCLPPCLLRCGGSRRTCVPRRAHADTKKGGVRVARQEGKWIIAVPRGFTGAPAAGGAWRFSTEMLENHVLQPSKYFLGVYDTLNGKKIELQQERGIFVTQRDGGFRKAPYNIRIVGHENVRSQAVAHPTGWRVPAYARVLCIGCCQACGAAWGADPQRSCMRSSPAPRHSLAGVQRILQAGAGALRREAAHGRGPGAGDGGAFQVSHRDPRLAGAPPAAPRPCVHHGACALPTSDARHDAWRRQRTTSAARVEFLRACDDDGASVAWMYDRLNQFSTSYVVRPARPPQQRPRSRGVACLVTCGGARA